MNVQAAPTLRVKTILAFGDSLTAGEVPDPCEFTACVQNTYPNESYPADLTTLLATRYVTQGAAVVNAFTLSSPNTTNCGADPPPPVTTGILVINAGCNGQAAAAPTTPSLLTAAMNTYQPGLVLLLLGANDVDTGGAQAVQSLAATVIGRGVPVFVGTLPPEVSADFTHGGTDNSFVVAFNAQLQSLIPQTGATLVDLYSDLATDVNDWISPYDGVHLTAAGYAEMARVWFAAIQKTYEVAPGAPVTTGTAKRNVMTPWLRPQN